MTEPGVFDLMPLEIDEWSPLTQAVSILSDAHFKVFNALEVTRGKRQRARFLRALATLTGAAVHIRSARVKAPTATFTQRGRKWYANTEADHKALVTRGLPSPFDISQSDDVLWAFRDAEIEFVLEKL